MEETARIDYTTASTDELLKALEQAGRTPDRALLEACLARRDDLAPGLMAWLENGNQQGDAEEWEEEDPRWYRDIHAGRLLIAFREEKALPLFADLLRDEDREHLREWFDTLFAHYGPPAVDMLIDLLKDRKAGVWVRIFAAVRLGRIALVHPEVRDRVTEVLRMRLPRVDEQGNFVIPPLADEDQVMLWTFIACELADLKDTASQAQGIALYEAGLIDEMVMGDLDAYLKIFDEEPRLPEPFDLIEKYHPPRRPILPPVNLDREPQDDLDTSLFEEMDEVDSSRYPIGYGSAPTFVREDPKVGRNDPCPCGSGKKYKKCCARR